MQRGLASVWIFPEVVEERCAYSGSERGVETVSREEAERTARSGATALMWACENGHIEAARLLVDKGADVNVQNTRTSAWTCVSGDAVASEVGSAIPGLGGAGSSESVG